MGFIKRKIEMLYSPGYEEVRGVVYVLFSYVFAFLMSMVAVRVIWETLFGSGFNLAVFLRGFMYFTFWISLYGHGHILVDKADAGYIVSQID